MTFDLTKATAFMATHGRLLDRRRFALTVGNERVADARAAAVAAVAAYRNPDGGFGSGLEPDLRSPESQPAGALHAFEVFDEVGPLTSPMAGQLCDWLATVSLPDGGIPFALPVTDPTGCSPVWTGADTSRSSLHFTSAVAGIAHRVARHDPVVRGHEWLARATDYCMREVVATDAPAHAYELMFVLRFLDAVHEVRPEAGEQLRRLGALVPSSGRLAVTGGLADEALYPLDIAPWPDGPLRDLLGPQVIEADLDRLAGQQHEDGGWDIDFAPASAAAALEWRSYTTVLAVQTLSARQATPLT